MTIKKIHHGILLVLPNLLNPYKLYRNLRHPIHEFLHTRHRQYPLDEDSYIHLVEHEFLGKLVTVDVIEKDNTSGVLSKLFRSDFYYGHCEYFPESFRLRNRYYISGGRFNLEDLLKTFWEKNDK